MVKLMEYNGTYTICIPKTIVKDKGFKKGQEFVVVYDKDGNLVLKMVDDNRV